MTTIYLGSALTETPTNRRLDKFCAEEGLQLVWMPDRDPGEMRGILESADLLVFEPSADSWAWLELGTALGASVPVLLYHEIHGVHGASWLSDMVLGRVTTGSELQKAIKDLLPGLRDNDVQAASMAIARVQAEFPC